MDETTMVVQGQITLHKVTSLRRGSCGGCFFTNLPCAEAAGFTENTPRIACEEHDYIWEVLECQS